jgi:hypothetical protein
MGGWWWCGGCGVWGSGGGCCCMHEFIHAMNGWMINRHHDKTNARTHAQTGEGRDNKKKPTPQRNATTVWVCRDPNNGNINGKKTHPYGEVEDVDEPGPAQGGGEGVRDEQRGERLALVRLGQRRDEAAHEHACVWGGGVRKRGSHYRVRRCRPPRVLPPTRHGTQSTGHNNTNQTAPSLPFLTLHDAHAPMVGAKSATVSRSFLVKIFPFRRPARLMPVSQERGW